MAFKLRPLKYVCPFENILTSNSDKACQGWLPIIDSSCMIVYIITLLT